MLLYDEDDDMLFYGAVFVRHTLTVTNWKREMQQFVYFFTFVSVIHAIKNSKISIIYCFDIWIIYLRSKQSIVNIED